MMKLLDKFFYRWTDCWGRHIRVSKWTIHKCPGMICIARSNKMIHEVNCSMGPIKGIDLSNIAMVDTPREFELSVGDWMDIVEKINS